MRTRRLSWTAAVALAAVAATLACSVLNRPTVGQMQRETQTVELGSASSANVELNFPIGELQVEGGAGDLMQATFRTNVEDWESLVEYDVQGDEGQLRVSQPGAEGANYLPLGDALSDVVNEWEIALSDDVPLELSIQLGAGVGSLALSRLDLSRLMIESGASVTTIDLTGAWPHDVRASVTGGIGELTINLPSEMGVRVNSDTGLVSVTTSGLTPDGDGYVNSAYGSAPYTLTLDLSAGVGSVELRVP
jgi:hypothetical protein